MREMKHDSSTISWNRLGDEWYELTQKGGSREQFIMPHMLRYLGDVKGKQILDLGCGEGGYARALAQKGADMTCVDCSARAIQVAAELAQKAGLAIRHEIRNSNDLFGVEDEAFDIVLCSMMLMDCEDLDGTLREVVRVLKRGGQLFASVLHPCFDGEHQTGIGRQDEGAERKVLVMNYYEPREWTAPLPKGTIPVIWRHRTMEDYVKAFVRSGLTIIDLNEPRATEDEAKASPLLAMLRRIPLFLYWRLEKR